MKIKGILFDKDGTLIDFFCLWAEAAKKVIPEFIRHNHLEEYQKLDLLLYESIGVYGEEIDPNGGLAYKSYDEIAKDMKAALEKRKIKMDETEIEEQIKVLFYKNTQGEDANIVPITELVELFEKLKEKKVYIGLATADTKQSAEMCMKKLGVLEYLDYIGADDGIRRPKPYPDMLLDFAEKNGIRPEEVLVAGDTKNDMIFAEKSGAISVGVLSGVSREKDLISFADYIIPSVKEIPVLLNSMEREG